MCTSRSVGTLVLALWRVKTERKHEARKPGINMKQVSVRTPLRQNVTCRVSSLSPCFTVVWSSCHKEGREYVMLDLSHDYALFVVYNLVWLCTLIQWLKQHNNTINTYLSHLWVTHAALEVRRTEGICLQVGTYMLNLHPP